MNLLSKIEGKQLEVRQKVNIKLGKRRKLRREKSSWVEKEEKIK